MLQHILRPVRLALPALLIAAGLPAQAVRATVTDQGTGAPVAGALVRVEEETGALVRAGFSDARGTVRLPVLGGGRYVVSAERAGYMRTRVTLLVQSAGETPADVAMAASPFSLDTVRVTAEATGSEQGSQTFERRRATGRGVYLDSAYVAAQRGSWPGDLLQSVPGIEVQTVHGPSGVRRPTTRMGARCLNSLVNGLPYYGGWPRWVPLEQTLRRADVVAVEVYRVFDEVPRELQRYSRANGACGLIIYWTEDGWESRSRGPDSGG
jgi:hypothetical protein